MGNDLRTIMRLHPNSTEKTQKNKDKFFTIFRLPQANSLKEKPVPILPREDMLAG